MPRAPSETRFRGPQTSAGQSLRYRRRILRAKHGWWKRLDQIYRLHSKYLRSQNFSLKTLEHTSNFKHAFCQQKLAKGTSSTNCFVVAATGYEIAFFEPDLGFQRLLALSAAAVPARPLHLTRAPTGVSRRPIAVRRSRDSRALLRQDSAGKGECAPISDFRAVPPEWRGGERRAFRSGKY